MPERRVLSVGQCMADHGAIARTFAKHFAIEVISADNANEALSILQNGSVHLVLVNRVLDEDGSSGLALIRQIKTDEALQKFPVMLVSNYDEAQEQATALGALPGFGKAALGQPRMLALVKKILD